MLYKPTTLPPQADLDKLRHYCRNSKHCDDVLKTPVENERDAFCCVRCHDEFYREHCRVCQEPFTSKTGNKAHKILCDRSRCRAAFRANPGAFWGRSYPRPISVKRTPKTSTISMPKRGVEPGRGWHQVAGPSLTPSSFRAATVPDGRDCTWAGGKYKRDEAENRKLQRAAIERNGYFTEPDWPEVIRPDGVKCFVTRFRSAASCRPAAAATARLIATIPDDLSIPDFLRRPFEADGEAS